jgi:S-layer like family, outer domain
VGSKFREGKIKPPTEDADVAKYIMNKIGRIPFASLLAKKHPKKSRTFHITIDRDIYFSKEKQKNLIVIGGTSINKITADLNMRLRIQYVQFKDYRDKRNYHSLARYVQNKLELCGYSFSSDLRDKKLGSIQRIKNPYNGQSEPPSYIIVIFGLGREGTKEAGNELIKEWKSDFKALEEYNGARVLSSEDLELRIRF